MSATDDDILPVARTDPRRSLDLVHARMSDTVVVYHPEFVGVKGQWLQSNCAIDLEAVR